MPTKRTLVREIQVEFPGISPYWVKVYEGQDGREELAFPDYDGTQLNFRQHADSPSLFKALKPGRPDFFLELGNGRELEYHDAFKQSTYRVRILQVHEPELA